MHRVIIDKDQLKEKEVSIDNLDEFIGHRIKTYRRLTNHKISLMADLLGISTHQYKKIESGAASIRIKHLWKLINFFNVDANYFLMDYAKHERSRQSRFDVLLMARQKNRRVKYRSDGDAEGVQDLIGRLKQK
ncbi:MAG: helix-turn-helix domain-containing protein [Alphaproteobacteria bacterium]|nr:helix-turn-helix domain-containing protein [Alphaproteobacteria bacterium]